MSCFECGGEAAHRHHVVPRSLGGTRTVPLCLACHAKVHGVGMAHPSLVKEGLSRARARGRKLGRPHAIDADVGYEVLKLSREGLTDGEIALRVGVSPELIGRFLRDNL